jgi:hypothetical protein
MFLCAGRIDGMARSWLISSTNIALHARDGTDAVLAKLAEHDGEVLQSVFSFAKLQRGAYRDPTAIRQARLEVCCAGCRLMPQPASPTAGSLLNAAGYAGAITIE